MLNKIPKILSPELVEILMEMGHGDEILLADANYPATTNSKRVVRADGIGIPELLDAILELLPLDSYSKYQAAFMEVIPGDKNVPKGEPPVWKKYKKSIEDNFTESTIRMIERQKFYEHSRGCFAIVQTGESALYGNLILRKGVVI
jgi:L-fucose mutarotase